MNYLVTDAGGPGEELARKAIEYFREAAKRESIDLVDFDPSAPLDQQIAWAEAQGLDIGCTYLRFSSKIQHSSEDQLRENILVAARLRIFIPPQLICLDEAKKGRTTRRVGLSRLKEILQSGRSFVLVLFKLSRLFRSSYKGHEFIAERVVENGHRAVVFNDGIDTNDKKAWKAQVQLRGILDDMYLDTLVDHVKAGLVGIFEKGWTVGPLGVGYRPKILPDAPLTNLGKPRTMPEVDPEAAKLISQQFDWIRDGMSLGEGLRRWLAAGGPCDPRSTTGRMTPTAYRRMLSNIRLTGRWEFGRNKSIWSSTKDYAVQQEQPDEEVTKFHCEDLRIVEDELFFAVQKRLAEMKRGPRGPKKNKPAQLWDLTTKLFFCAACSTEEEFVRLHQTGAHGRGMQCRNGARCTSKSAVRREEAVRAICEKLQELIQEDRELIGKIVARSQELDARGDEGRLEEIKQLENRERALTRRIDGLFDLAGDGSEEDRRETKAKIRAARSERDDVREKLAHARRALEQFSRTLTTDDVNQILNESASLLTDGAAGQLGEDAVYRALAVFRDLTGGRIMVHVEPRPARKQTNVRGVFQPQLLAAVRDKADLCLGNDVPTPEKVEVWLRKPP
ncbi:MAG: recombinase family protein, partial [Planctomycetes bacterium]|nr:recombinase family protein [Planctomycetota bacterium]